MPFVYMYGKPEVQAEYMERMRHRGSSEQFIEKYGSVIAEQYPSRAQDNRGTFKIEMNPGEYISDYIWKVYKMPPKYIDNHKFNSKQLKMAFIDLDGTLLDRKSQISDLTKKVIQLLKNKVKVVITTGRGIDTVSPILKELKLDSREDFVICCNGALVIKGDGEVVAQKGISSSNIEYLLKILDPALLPLCILRTLNNKFYINDIEDMQKFLSNNKVYKIMIKRPEDEHMLNTLKMNCQLKKRFNIYSSADGLLELVSAKVSKAIAGQQIANLYSLGFQNLIAIGDAENDLELFNIVECSVAVCNADKLVKLQAKYISDSNNDDGVAKALIRVFKVKIF